MKTTRTLALLTTLSILLAAPPQAYAASELGFTLDEHDYYTSTVGTLLTLGGVLILVAAPFVSTSSGLGANEVREQEDEKKQKDKEFLDQYREKALMHYIERGEVMVCDALAMGAGPALDDLALIMSVEPDARPAWYKALRTQRATITALLHDTPHDPQTAAALREQLEQLHRDTHATR
jgi:hypothetical protein